MEDPERVKQLIEEMNSRGYKKLVESYRASEITAEELGLIAEMKGESDIAHELILAATDDARLARMISNGRPLILSEWIEDREEIFLLRQTEDAIDAPSILADDLGVKDKPWKI